MKVENITLLNIDHLKEYLISFGRVLNVSGLEIRLNIPHRTLRDWIKGKQGLPDHHLEKVLEWAKCYGYKPSLQYGSIL